MPSGSPNDILVAFQGSFTIIRNSSPSLLFLTRTGHCRLIYWSLLNSLQMQFNQTYIPDEVSVQVNKPMEQIYNNQVLLQNCLPFPDCPASWDTLLHRQSMEEFEQKTKETMNNLYSKRHRSSGMSLTNRRDLNRERERKRQTRLRKRLTCFAA